MVFVSLFVFVVVVGGGVGVIIVVGPRNLTLKSGQNQVSDIWDIVFVCLLLLLFFLMLLLSRKPTFKVWLKLGQ